MPCTAARRRSASVSTDRCTTWPSPNAAASRSGERAGGEPVSAAVAQPDHTTAYRHPVEDVVATLGSDARRGLSREEARARLQRHGRNELTAAPPIPAWRKFLVQFQDVLVVLLLVATAMSAGLWLSERESALPYEAMAIFAVVLLNAAMGFIQQS